MLSQKQKGSDVSIEPLEAKVQSLSRTGNLTITFNKPIILPPIEIIRESTDSKENDRRLDAVKSADFKIPVKEIVDITIESEYYESENEELEIVDYDATRLT